MKIQPSKTVTMASLRAIKEKMGQRPMDEPLHASDIYQCARKTVASRLYGEPGLSREDIEIMFPGYAVQEYAWGEEPEGVKWHVEKDNDESDFAIFSIDGWTDGAVLEMKTTAAYPKYLEQPNQAWVDRTKAYCAVKEVTECYILCYSVTGRKFIEWHIEFTQQELDEEAKWLRRRIPELNNYIKRGELPSVTERRYAYECKYCSFKDHEDVNCRPLIKAAGMRLTPPVKGKAK